MGIALSPLQPLSAAALEGGQRLRLG